MREIKKCHVREPLAKMSKKEFETAIKSLQKDGLIIMIDNKWFLTPEGLSECKKRGYQIGS